MAIPSPTAPRNLVQEGHTWDLSPLYTSPDLWEMHYQELETKLPTLESFSGKLAESPASLFSATSAYLQFNREIEQLYTYAHLRSDEDTSDSTNFARLGRAQNLYARFAAATSYFTPELLTIPTETLRKYLDNAELRPFKRMILDIVRYAPHTKSAAEENLLALGSEVFGSCATVFSQLNNADLDFGEIEVQGKHLPLTHGSYLSFLRHQDRNIRARAFSAYYQAFEKHKHTISAALNGSLKKDVFLARARGYESALHSALFSDEVPAAVYDALIDSVSRHLPSLHRYFDIRRRVMNLVKLAPYDTYVPLVQDVTLHHSFAEAAQVLYEAFAPLGDEYRNTLRTGLLEKRWVDIFENKGKRSGAYHSGCYDSPPYMLMNYKDDDINDIFTLVHEAGHAMHTWHSNRSQKYQDHNYTIFAAEVASTFNEQLLLHYLRHKYSGNKPVQLFLINHALDEIRGTLFRQAMFAEFEKKTHAVLEGNGTLTAETFKEIYEPLLAKHFGDHLERPANMWVECLRIPHFYSAFYVYKYSTGVAAAVSLSSAVLAGKPGALERYLGFLNAGCSKAPLEILKDAGVDLTTPQPVEDTVRYFDALLDEFELLLQ